MEVIGYQLSIFLIITISSFISEKTMNWVTFIIVLFTLSMVYTSGLMVLQFITIIISYSVNTTIIEKREARIKRRERETIAMRFFKVIIGIALLVPLIYGIIKFIIFLFDGLFVNESILFSIYLIFIYLFIMILPIIIVFILFDFVMGAINNRINKELEESKRYLMFDSDDNKKVTNQNETKKYSKVTTKKETKNSITKIEKTHSNVIEDNQSIKVGKGNAVKKESDILSKTKKKRKKSDMENKN